MHCFLCTLVVPYHCGCPLSNIFFIPLDVKVYDVHDNVILTKDFIFMKII